MDSHDPKASETWHLEIFLGLKIADVLIYADNKSEDSPASLPINEAIKAPQTSGASELDPSHIDRLGFWLNYMRNGLLSVSFFMLILFSVLLCSYIL